jgi:hypothetical protein
MNSQRLKDISYVDLRTACDTDMKIRKTKFDEILEEQEDPLARGRNTRGVGAFIDGVNYKIDGTFIKGEYLFQILVQGVIAGLFRAIVVLLVKTRHNVATWT